ncbi:hypothetical protein PRZ48_002460 [Zasmidium cellare]|uniref:RING-type domain-containing protein n=1 Tax=Zasmidium cellare TaxID=395010 RepID=A0ABR0F677_ZASCE|nr:hypothetical protein PRZ48_002460 [Zasmidium cellare]
MVGDRGVKVKRSRTQSTQDTGHLLKRNNFQFNAAKSRNDPVLAFHPTRLNLLAASNGSQLAILDVESSTAVSVFNGNGRTITAICFDQSGGDTVTTGTADGSICVWSMKETSRPVHRLRAFRNACNEVSVYSGHADLLAAISGTRLCVWKLPDSKPLVCIRVKPATLSLFTWCLEPAGQILTLSHGGLLSLYDLDATIRGSLSRKRRTTNHDSDEEDESHSMRSFTDEAPPRTAFNLGCSIAQAEVIGQNGLVILPSSRKDLYFYNYSLENDTTTQLWRLHKDNAIGCFALCPGTNSIDVVTVSEDSTEVYKVPSPVLDSMGWPTDPDPAAVLLGGHQTTEPKTKPHRVGYMKPQKTARPVRALGKTAPNRARSKSIKAPSVKPKRYNDEVASPGTPATHMTSSLELPKERHNNDEDSPMPFLSPSIPARKVSPGLTTPLDESLQLPPLALSDSIVTVADHTHESDSDDETFAGDMKGSGTLLPGGINVPLPRSCGALFSPNGQLITFFPYSIKRVVNENPIVAKGLDNVEKHGEEVDKLFPSFGNLSSTHQERDSPSTSNKTLSDDLHTSTAPRFAIRSSSFDGAPSWAAHTSPTKAKMQSLPGEHRVNVSIRNLETLTPTRQSLANTYRLFDEPGLTSSDICRMNATHASKTGLQLSAGAWRLLGIILDSDILDPQITRSFRNLSAIFLGQRPTMSRNTSMASSRGASSIDRAVDILPLLNLPFGRTWALERLFAWAEDRADVQLLAYMSALLKSICETLAAHNKSRNLQRRTKGSRSTVPGSDQDATMFPPDLPTLRTESAATATADSSPNKVYRSKLSSGNPSQPTTPYLESSSSTPPFTFSHASRQNSRILTPGSASPEHHRSSFGAAAKNYAASIAERFGSYGSSPPLKKFGTSPGNELSSSLPNATGSWSKSVSFASSMEPPKSTQQSLSLAQEDDNYDSDRTVEDNSVLNTPKRPHTGVSYINKKGSFYEEASTATPTQLIPEQLAMKCGFWRHQYAEQLRSWNMLNDAAEMADFPTSKIPKSSDSSESDQNVVPETHSGRRFNDCSICYCVVQAAEQTCPACLHTTHATCLQEFVSAVGADSFTCPTGCGCDCTSAAESPLTLDEIAVEEAAEYKQPFKKRSSLTDPLRLRQRLQGESW